MAWLIDFAWAPAICIQWYVILIHPDKAGKGKRLTLPLRLLAMKSFIQKPSTPKYLLCLPSGMRGAQLLTLFFCVLLPAFLQDIRIVYPVYWGALTALYVDDYFTDNDKWKRRWESAKNKVKWLWTPAPTPVRSPA